jgi:Peptidase family M1 domain
MRIQVALLLVVAVGAALASNALATTPRDNGESEDSAPAEVGVASTSSSASSPSVGRLAAAAACMSGARTLSKFGDRLYPEMGNGGYTSVHSDVFLAYDTATNLFLPGTHVVHTDRSTQCLSDFSLDFEQTNINTANGSGPNLTVSSVQVNGQPATFTFKQPTYPGDPNGQDDADPLAHAVSNANPVSATNPNPPACSPQVSNSTQNGTQCPANKLVITPATPIPAGTTFTVTVNYTGRPGVHTDGDGSTEGWFRVNTTAAPNDGSFVTTEPVGTDSWLPLNNHPSAKPTYDFYDTVPVGKTAVANGELVGAILGSTFAPVGPTSVNAADANFPNGSWTWHWRSPEPIANYLVENSIGSYDITAKLGANGIGFYQVQGSAITATRKALNKIAIDMQEDITNFQTTFNGPYPFTTAGVVVGIPSASFEEEMQTKITFAGGTIGGNNGTNVGTLAHENMHQWFGDNVSEAAFNLTFWKEGFARLGEYLTSARTAATNAGGIGTPAGDAAFEQSLINQFNATYGGGGNNWTVAPSNPQVTNLFTTANTYTRPGTAYLALWRILGRDTMIATMKRIQADYGGGNITEAQLEAEFHQALPNQSAGCHARLDQFFTQWFDTAYPSGGGANKPQITGPGLAGPGFLCAPTVTYTLNPPAPTGNNGWYRGNVTLTWNVDNGLDSTTTTTGCVSQTFSTDGTFTVSCSASNTIGASGPVSLTIKRDATAPTTTATLTPTSIGEWYSPRTVTLNPTDPTTGSGVASTSYRLDAGPLTPYTGSFFVATFGPHVLTFSSTDAAGNVETTKTVSWGSNFNAAAQLAGLSALVTSFGLDKGLTHTLQDHIDDANKRLGKQKDVCNQLDGFLTDVIDELGKPKPRMSFGQGVQLLSVNQIEMLVGCIPSGSPLPEAELDVITLIHTIETLDLKDGLDHELTDLARQAGEQIVQGDAKHACHNLSDLSEKIAEQAKKGKLTSAQSATLDAAVAKLSRDIGC